MKKIVVTGLLTLVSTLVSSEDIELYVSEGVKLASQKTQVLIIFDNSGSMTTEEEVKVSYDPNTNYPALDGYTKFSEEYLYYKREGDVPTPDDSDESRKFLASINSCHTSKAILASTGIYTGHIRRYRFKGNSGEWKNIPKTKGHKVKVLDCEDDVINEEPTNISSLPQGYPIDGLGDQDNPIYHTSDINAENVDWSGDYVTLYSANYLRWYHGVGSEVVKKPRIDMAIESITNVINSAPSIDFGLEVFNYNNNDTNSGRNGGRLVFGIKEMTDANKASYLDIVQNKLIARGNTPLCESLYESSRYFAGKSVVYGDDDSDYGSYNGNTPPRDTSIENGSKVYKAPFTSCNTKAYVILITDGEPTQDHHADSKVEALTSTNDAGDAISFNGTKYDGNYLAGLAGWMSDYDVNLDLSGKQTIDTYTIGFSSGADDAAPLLKETAKRGGGLYFKAQDSVQLTNALLSALQDLEPSNDSLTSASVAANNFDRTQTLNAVYYAMFEPENGPRWQGNVKKYKVVNETQVGQNSVAALNEATGHFSEDVTSFWSPANSKDGDTVAEGGVAEMLRNKTNRVIYSDIGTGGSLALFTRTNVDDVFDNDEDALAAELDVTTEQIDATLNWAKGIDVDDEDGDGSTTDMRYDVFADPLHSKPLVVNYGNAIRILIGTNAGVLHMFEDDTTNDVVDEKWAFMPKEFLPNIKLLRDNFASEGKVYGIDGKITSYIQDGNGDGIVNGTDKVWIFFGLRRGGSSYYAMDITNPDAPSLMWHINTSTDGFSKLGQSWSQPKVVYSKLNASGSGESAVAAPVVIFGGGYDIGKDLAGVGQSDGSGNGIYMVDAKTGTLKWSLKQSGGTTSHSGLSDSIPSSIATLDSNGDGFVDRLYTGDTGGNVWRVDMPDKNPTDSDNPWTAFKLASLGGETLDSHDRRFFNEPSIVRTFITETIETTIVDEEGVEVKVVSRQEKPYDAVLIGSGDRSNPLGVDTLDAFFMIKDQNIATKSLEGDDIPSVITKGDLFNYTHDPFGIVEDDDREDLEIEVSKHDGWYIDFETDGEKSSSSAIAINGIAYFTSFIPPSVDIDVDLCEVPNGYGFLYAVDLALGTKKYLWDNDANPDGITDNDDRKVFISEQFLGSPTLIVIPQDDGDENTEDQAVGNIIVGRKIIPVGFQLKTMRTYQYIKEEQ